MPTPVSQCASKGVFFLAREQDKKQDRDTRTHTHAHARTHTHAHARTPTTSLMRLPVAAQHMVDNVKTAPKWSSIYCSGFRVRGSGFRVQITPIGPLSHTQKHRSSLPPFTPPSAPGAPVAGFQRATSRMSHTLVRVTTTRLAGQFDIRHSTSVMTTAEHCGGRGEAHGVLASV